MCGDESGGNTPLYLCFFASCKRAAKHIITMYSMKARLTALHYQSQVKWFISTLLTTDKSGTKLNEVCCFLRSGWIGSLHIPPAQSDKWHHISWNLTSICTKEYGFSLTAAASNWCNFNCSALNVTKLSWSQLSHSVPLLTLHTTSLIRVTVETSSAPPTDSQHFIKLWQQNHLSPLHLPSSNVRITHSPF